MALEVRPKDQRDPQKVAAGRAGGYATWAPDRRHTVRLDELRPAERALVVALVDGLRAAEAARAQADLAIVEAAGAADGAADES